MGERMRDRLCALPALSGAAPPDQDPSAVFADPVAHFTAWFDSAVSAGVPEPHVMVLSTVDRQGCPDARPLILRDLDARGWAFASSASQRKGVQLAADPVGSLTFWWQPIMRCVRLQGPVTQASPEESAADLARRSPAAQDSDEARDWTLYRLLPRRAEFWQGSPDRRHTRVVYSATDRDWEVDPGTG